MTNSWNDALTTTPAEPGKYIVAIGRANKTGSFDRRYADFSTVLAFWTGDEWILESTVYYDFVTVFWMPMPEPPCKPGEYPHGVTSK